MSLHASGELARRARAADACDLVLKSIVPIRAKYITHPENLHIVAPQVIEMLQPYLFMILMAISAFPLYLPALFEIDGQSSSRMPALEGLRALGAVLVFCVHYATLASPWVPAGGSAELLKVTFDGAGHLGVDIFFAISGFLIYGGLLVKRRPLVPYIRRRLQRLYPTFLTVLSIYLILSVVFPGESKIPQNNVDATWYIIQNILLLPGVFVIVPIISVAWSLSYEVLFYATMPVLFIMTPLRRWRKATRVAFFCAIWILILMLGPYHGRSTMFIVGIVVYETLDIGPGKAALWDDVFAAAGFFTVAALATLRELMPDAFGEIGLLYSILIFAMGFALCRAAARGRGRWAQVLAKPPVRWFGNMSYSFYLVHGLCLQAFFLVVGILLPPSEFSREIVFWLGMPLSFTLAMVGAATLFLLVERPRSLDGVNVIEIWRRQRQIGERQAAGSLPM